MKVHIRALVAKQKKEREKTHHVAEREILCTVGIGGENKLPNEWLD